MNRFFLLVPISCFLLFSACRTRHEMAPAYGDVGGRSVSDVDNGAGTGSGNTPGPFGGSGGANGSNGSGDLGRGGRDFSKGTVVDGVYITEHIPTKRMIPYEYLNESGTVRMEDDDPTRRAQVKTERAGILTAAELNDLGNWELWKDVRAEGLGAYRQIWQLYLSKRYTVLAQSETKCPLANVPVRLKQNGQVVWTAQTDNKGLAQLWLTEDTLSPVAIEYGPELENRKIAAPIPFEKGINHVTLAQPPAEAAEAIDIVFAVDATSSMRDEIEFLKADLMRIVLDVKQELPASDVHLGSVFYQCAGEGNDYLTVASDLSPDIDKTLDFIDTKFATGGGEEAVDVALDEVVNKLSWRPEARTKLVFILLDEPPYATSAIAANMAKVYCEAAAKGIRIVPCISSNGSYGTGRSLEYLMRNAALATNSTLLFLTDHSGVGGSHTIPYTDHYEVEFFRDALIRVIRQFAEKASCEPVKWPLAVAEDVSTNRKEVTNALLDSLTTQESDSLIAASLLPFSGFSTAEELLQHRPLKQVDTLALLTHFNRRAEEMTVFPLPTTDKVTIRTTAACTCIELLDGNGHILLRRQMSGETEFPLDLGGFPTGNYYVRCKVGETVLQAMIPKV